VVHGIPGDRVILEGDLVKVDVGVTYQGYIADAARTYPAGQVTPAAGALMRETREALKRGIAAARPGNRVGHISRAVQEHVEAHGYSVVRELTGHGVGKNLHEEPIIPNFVSPGPDPLLKSGMVLAIEPMVNAGSHEVFTEANGWTVKSRDRSLSCHFEDTIAILMHGQLNLTRVAETDYGS
jgi:methionyl aminopeptidase